MSGSKSLNHLALTPFWQGKSKEKVGYKPGLDYPLECFLPSIFARSNHQQLAWKFSKIPETDGVVAPPPPPPHPHVD